MTWQAACAECKRRRDDVVIGTNRWGGGSYKRPGRWYSRTICVPCARDVVAHADAEVERVGRAPEKVWMMSVSTTRRALERHDAAVAARGGT